MDPLSFKNITLPDRYVFRVQADGPRANGFVRAEHQTALIHTRDRSPQEHSTPLTVFAADSPAAGPRYELAGTEGAQGVRIDLGVRDTEAVYHDGIWAVGAHVADERDLDEGFEWMTGTCHSLTVRTATAVYGVRAPRDVPLADLVAVAKSLPLG